MPMAMDASELLSSDCEQLSTTFALLFVWTFINLPFSTYSESYLNINGISIVGKISVFLNSAKFVFPRNALSNKTNRINAFLSDGIHADELRLFFFSRAVASYK